MATKDKWWLTPEHIAVHEAYTAWARQFARDYAAACRSNPNPRLSEHTEDFEEYPNQGAFEYSGDMYPFKG